MTFFVNKSKGELRVYSKNNPDLTFYFLVKILIFFVWTGHLPLDYFLSCIILTWTLPEMQLYDAILIPIHPALLQLRGHFEYRGWIKEDFVSSGKKER